MVQGLIDTKDKSVIHKNEMPRFLSSYNGEDFAIQMKVKFVYSILISLLVIIALIIVTSAYTQINFVGSNYGILTSEILLFITTFLCVIILYKGFYVFAVHLIIFISMAAMWGVMWVERSYPLARLDSIVFIFPIFTMILLYINKYKSLIIFYTLLNIGILLIFMKMARPQLNISRDMELEYILDVSVAIITMAVIIYNIFKTSEKILDNSIQEINLRKQAEIELQKSESFRKRVFDSSRIPMVVMDGETFQFIDCNQAATEIYKLSSYSETIGKTHLDVSAPTQYDGTPSAEKAQFYINKAFSDGSIVFDWKHQRQNGEVWDAEVHLMRFQIDAKEFLQFSLIDITERKQVENSLAKSELHVKTISNNFNAGMIYQLHISQTGKRKFTFLSNSVKQLYGVTPEEAIFDSMNIYGKLHKDDIQQLLDAENEATKTLSTFRAEARLLDPKGEIRWSSFISTPTLLADGSICWDGIEFIITERKEAEQELKKSEEKFRYLIDNMNEVFMMVDNEDRVLFVNKKFTEKLGYTSEEIIGKIGYEILVDKEDQKVIIAQNKRRLEKEINQYEVSFRAKNGQKIEFLISGAPLIDMDGKTIGSMGTLTDITKRKHAENLLKESEERYRKLIEAFTDIIMVFDLKGNILYGNEAFEKITGITPPEYSNLNRTARIHPEDAFLILKEVKKLLAGDENHTPIIENRFIDSWGNIHWFSGRIAKIFLNGQLVLQTITRDISDKKVAEKELENYKNHLETLVKERTDELTSANEELNATNDELFSQKEELQSAIEALNSAQNKLIQSEKMAALGILSSGIAHEINNPLNFIHGGILGIEDYFTDNFPDHKDNINPLISAINVGVKRASEIVTSLSHYSRRDDLPHTVCDLHDIINNCLTMLQNKLKNKIEVEKIFTENTHVLLGNESKLHQAILNIISNAEQSIDKNGNLKIATNVIDRQIEVRFTDNGGGISQENMPRIFDPFFTTKAPGKGTGLGLSITYNIIAEHKGTIDFESQIGNGTTVIIKLPIIN